MYLILYWPDRREMGIDPYVAFRSHNCTRQFRGACSPPSVARVGASASWHASRLHGLGGTLDLFEFSTGFKFTGLASNFRSYGWAWGADAAPLRKEV